jgi:hypothetical protein
MPRRGARKQDRPVLAIDADDDVEFICPGRNARIARRGIGAVINVGLGDTMGREEINHPPWLRLERRVKAV